MNKATNIKNGNVNLKCEYCGGCGYHKLSCSTQKVTVFLSDVKVDGVTAESEGVSGKHEGATKRCFKLTKPTKKSTYNLT